MSANIEPARYCDVTVLSANILFLLYNHFTTQLLHTEARQNFNLSPLSLAGCLKFQLRSSLLQDLWNFRTTGNCAHLNDISLAVPLTLTFEHAQECLLAIFFISKQTDGLGAAKTDLGVLWSRVKHSILIEQIYAHLSLSLQILRSRDVQSRYLKHCSIFHLKDSHQRSESAALLVYQPQNRAEAFKKLHIYIRKTLHNPNTVTSSTKLNVNFHAQITSNISQCLAKKSAQPVMEQPLSACTFILSSAVCQLIKTFRLFTAIMSTENGSSVAAACERRSRFNLAAHQIKLSASDPINVVPHTASAASI
ncbi:hypothetical protein C8R45DRAFT_933908 [Mycena sanguinolenta]|nr:hypothetical protein C8R45DRAFT_933908 [Mycena sanguinolenta]